MLASEESNRAMSRDWGPELPANLRARLGGTDLPSVMGRAHLVVTVDSQGRPHPAMLSYGEILATGPRELRVATYRGSTTAQNIRANGRLTLCLVDADMAYYVKGRAEELPPMEAFPRLARFRVAVDQVLEDFSRAEIEGEARVSGGITFTVGAASDRWLEDWERLIGALPRP